MAGRTRVLVCDDYPLIRMALREELEDAGFDVCAEAADADGAVSAALREAPDLCLVDVGIPGHGLAAAERILAETTAKVVLITATPSDEDMHAAARLGASGYLAKDVAPTRLPRILLDVAAGEVAFPRRLMAPLVARYAASAAGRV